MLVHPILEQDFDKSKLVSHERGMRRYYPTGYKSMGNKCIAHACKILCNKEPKSKLELGQAILFGNVDHYLDKLDDGYLWVRTIYKV